MNSQWRRDRLWLVAHHLSLTTELGQLVNLALIRETRDDAMITLDLTHDDETAMQSLLTHCLRAQDAREGRTA